MGRWMDECAEGEKKKKNVAQFSWNYFTDNSLYTVAKNIWNVYRLHNIYVWHIKADSYQLLSNHSSETP